MKKDRKEPAKLKRKEYEAELRELQAELCQLQDWVRHTGARIIVVFEGRDAAGKGGTIRALTERVSLRVFRTVALPAPSDRERSQMHVQRYLAHFPAAGEVVIFDRSWYNRAGVENVKLPARSLKGAYDDTASLAGRRFVPDRYRSR